MRRVFLLSLLALAPAALMAQPDYNALADKYRKLMNSDPANATAWAVCNTSALAGARMSPEAFEKYARRMVATLKLNAPGKPNPCPDVLGPYWDNNSQTTNSSSGSQGSTGNNASGGKISVGTTYVPKAVQCPMPPKFAHIQGTVGIANGGSAIQAGGTATPIKTGKYAMKREISISVDHIPGFVQGKSAVAPAMTRGSYRGLYLVQ